MLRVTPRMDRTLDVYCSLRPLWCVRCRHRMYKLCLGLLMFMVAATIYIQKPINIVVEDLDQPPPPILQSSKTNTVTCTSNLLGKLHDTWPNTSEVKTPIDLPGHIKSNDKCYHYVTSGHTKFATLRTLYGGSTIQAGDLVTFVTQLSFSRLERLVAVLNSWPGPVSAAVYVNPAELEDFITAVCTVISPRDNVRIHLVLETGVYYPINYLRNVALEGAITDLVYLSDVDFIPSTDVAEVAHNVLEQNATFFHKTVLVIPAFEVTQKEFAENRSPDTKAKLIHLWDEHIVKPARLHKWDPGHMPTKYDQWKTAEKIYQVAYRDYYEPYIIMNRILTPPYCNEFVERQRDKTSHLLEVWAAGFEFRVSPQSFCLHLPHSYSTIAMKPSVHQCALHLYGKFEERLKTKYHFTQTPGVGSIL